MDNAMSEREYRQALGLNSTELMNYAERGGDYILSKRKKPLEDSWDFVYGRAFEDWVRSQSEPGFQWDQYFLLEDQGAGISQSFCLEWVKKAGFDWESRLKRNKPKKDQEIGDLSKTHKNYNYLIQQCQQNSGKYPIPDDLWQMLCVNFESFKKMSFRGVPFADILPFCEFQRPFYWDCEIMLPGSSEAIRARKKALVDMLVIEQGDNHDTCWPFDIKTTANFVQFRKNLKYRYYIQSAHYTEGLEHYYNNRPGKPVRVMPMQFLVVSKSEADLFQAGIFQIDPDTWQVARARYNEIVEKYLEWEQCGFPEHGWKGTEYVKIY